MKLKSCYVFVGTRATSLFAALLVSGVMALPGKANATIITLTDANSVAKVDLDSSAGMFHWAVDGQNQLNQQWFWYRVGNGLQQPINTISTASYTLLGTSGVLATYANAQVSLEMLYILAGASAGSGKADIIESITVYNHTAAPLDFHFFQYSDFNLLGTPGGDSIILSGNPGDGYDFAYQWKGLTQIAEAINSPVANRAEAGTTDQSPNTLTRLNTVVGLQLNNVDMAGPGDATWALQWDVSIPAGGSFDVIKDKKLSIVPIPEPSAVALIAMSFVAWGLARRRQSS